jgi:hypothetical protein
MFSIVLWIMSFRLAQEIGLMRGKSSVFNVILSDHRSEACPERRPKGNSVSKMSLLFNLGFFIAPLLTRACARCRQNDIPGLWANLARK